MPSNEKLLNIQAASRLSAVSEHNLRAWERRYGAVSPTRLDNGRRIYSMKDVERLQLLMRLVNQGLSIGRIASLPTSSLQAMLDSGGAAHLAFPRDADITAAKHLKAVLQHAQGYDFIELRQELSRARTGLPATKFVLRLLAPLLHEIGVLIASGRLSVAQKQALSALVRDQIALVLDRYPASYAPFTLVLSTPEGVLHELGVLMSAILCAERGLGWHFVGCNLPAKDLALAARHLKADAVLLGPSAISEELLAKPLHRYLTQLDQGLPAKCAIWVGSEKCLSEIPRRSEQRRVIRHFGSLESLDLALENQDRSLR